MFGFRPKLPITDADRMWVDDGFRRLELLLGRERMVNANVILPTAEFFPDPYDGDEVSLECMFRRVCGYMNVDRDRLELELFADQSASLRELTPYWSEQGHDAAGIYTAQEEGRLLVAVKESQLDDPLALVATLAHELCHVILLGPGLLSGDEPDMESLTDVATVYLGMGVFTANSAQRFEQHQDERKIGWSTRTLGYLPEQVFGYALATFAHERGEKNPTWAKHLTANVKSDYKQSREWLEKNA